MKKPITCLLVALMATATIQVYAQNVAKAEKKEVRKENDKHTRTHREAMRKLEGSEVSQLSKDAFSSDFGDVGNVTWVHHYQFGEANFMDKGL